MTASTLQGFRGKQIFSAQNGAASIVSAISMAVTGKSEEEDDEYEKPRAQSCPVDPEDGI